MIDRFYTQSFTPQTWTAAAAYPYQETWTNGTAFKGAIDTVSSNDRFADGQLAAISTHIILTKTSVSLTKGQRIVFGSRTFDIMGIPDPVYLRAGHHQEVYVKEVT